MGKVNISYSELYNFYIELNNTLENTAKKFCCDRTTILSYLQEFNITKGKSVDKIVINKEELYDCYIVKDFSIDRCAEIFMCSPAVIIRRLRKYNIKKFLEFFTKDELYKEYILNNHTVSECMNIFGCTRWMIESRITKYGMYKPKEIIRRSDIYFEIPFDDLYNYYIVKNKTVKECALYFECSTGKINSEIKRYGIVKKKSYKSINKNELYEFYIIQNHSYKETAKKFVTSVPSIIRACRYYKIVKDRSLVANIARETKLRNHTYGKSKPEDGFYNYLCDKYGRENVFRQYRDKRYPFSCDFYIECLDTFVELNLFWTHGDSPFNINNLEHIKILNQWKERAKTRPHYLQAIETWTIRDPLKIKTAKDNNLKYIMYYKNDNLYDGRV